jgi:hypothetical protein
MLADVQERREGDGGSMRFPVIATTIIIRL